MQKKAALKDLAFEDKSLKCASKNPYFDLAIATCKIILHRILFKSIIVYVVMHVMFSID